MTDLINIERNGQELTADEITATMEKFAAVFAKVKAIALKGTTSHDWCDQSGTPYMLISGAEKVKNLFGISIVDVDWSKANYEDEKGVYYVITYKGTFSWKFGCVEMTGVCSSRDKFFGKDKALHDVELTNIQKKAYCNMLGRGIKSLLGLNRLTWDDLKSVGLSREGSTKVEYRTTQAASEDMAAKQQKLRELILASVGGDANQARAALKMLTEFKKTDGTVFEGHTDINKLTEKQLDIAIRKMKG